MFESLFRFRFFLLFAYMFAAILSMMLIASTFNGGFQYSVEILAIPAALIVFGFTFANRRRLSVFYPNRNWVIWLIAALYYTIVMLFGWQYVMVVNAVLSDGKILTVNGQIAQKFRAGKGGAFVLSMIDTQSGKPFDVEVSIGQYNSLKVGSNYRTCFKNGIFGIPFNWRYDSNASACTQNR